MQHRVTPANLSETMDFDHVIEVRPDLTVIDRNDIYAPDLFEGKLQDDAWTLVGPYSGQQGGVQAIETFRREHGAHASEVALEWAIGWETIPDRSQAERLVRISELLAMAEACEVLEVAGEGIE